MDILVLLVITAVIAAGGLWMVKREKKAYPPDDGPLSAADIEQIRAAAAPLLPKGAPLRKRSLLDL